MDDELDVEALRAQTPGCAHRTHLNNAGAALMSTATLAAMTDQLQLEATIGGYEAAARAEEHIAATYLALAELVGGRAGDIALFDNSTHAWNAAFYSVPLRPGDRILTGRAEYGSNVLAYLQVARRTGAEVVVVPDDDAGRIDLDALADLVDDRTRLIGLTWVPTAGGLVNPAAEVGRIARAADVLYLLDATQVVGQLPVDVAALGCDMLTGTGRKFLRGPRGTGFLWVRPAALERLDPHVVEIRSATWDGRRSFRWADGARRFETWENSYVNVVGLGSAVRQALDLGLEPIARRVRALGERLRTGLDGVDGVRTHDLGADRCAIVTAAVAGRPAAEVAGALAVRGINVSTTVAEHNQFDTENRGVHPLVRFSPHYFNTEAELDDCVAAVARIAAAAA
ncbi:aminotransferase class V-fold PLP-dependent enzyme [Pseudonocardia lacus]|uniref:aminotransferase class V-fold PLP-dependent enzyme n=1 Tax=Pseudonocardia lacus TaxID=2835865 RepID=UPI0027E29A4C|nr:aminotransferase class V-fold PLP-dependent enzyme [Pseudonocardia lacus]